MSYILEALRKSEKERRQEKIPTLQDISAPRHTPPTKGNALFSRFFLGLSILALLIAFVLVGFMLRKGWFASTSNKQASPQQKTRLLSQTTADEKIPGKQSETGFPQENANQSTPRKALVPDTIEKRQKTPHIIREPAPLRLSPEKDDAVVINRRDSNAMPQTDLPPLIQEDLHNMKFAGHAYSENHALRLIMINNKILHEGDPIDTDLRLGEITENGVVILYGSQHIRINLF